MGYMGILLEYTQSHILLKGEHRVCLGHRKPLCFDDGG